MYTFLNWVFAAWNNGVNTFLRILGQSPQSFQGGSGWLVVERLYPLFVAVGASLVPIFFLFGLVSESVNLRDKMDFEHIIKLLIRLLLAEWLVINGIELIKLLFEIIGNMIAYIAGGINITQLTIAPEVETMIENANMLESILPFAVLAIVAFAAYVFSYILLYFAYFRFFKIYAAVALAPIALAPLAGGMVNDSSRQFTKYIINVTVEAIIMIIAIMIFTVITNSGNVIIEDTSNMWSLVIYFAQVLFGMGATVGGIKGSEMVVKNILGL